MIAHVTNELLNIQTGGIGSLLNQILMNSPTQNADFYLIIDERETSIDKVKNSFSNVFVMTLSDFKIFNPQNKYQKIYFHNFYLFRKDWMGRKHYVCHSNLIIENKFEPWTINPIIPQFQMHAFIESDENVFVSNSDYEASKRTWEENPYLSVEKKLLVCQKPKRVIYNGIQLPHIEDVQFELQRRINLFKNRDQLTLGFLGRFAIRKGLIELVENFPDRHQLVLAGGGPGRVHPTTESILEKTLQARTINNVSNLGFCDIEKKKTFFNSIDALVVPSSYEPFGMVILEAFASGVPVIAKKTGGPLEILGESYPFYIEDISKNCLDQKINELRSLAQHVDVSYDYLRLVIEYLKKFDIQKTISEYE